MDQLQQVPASVLLESIENSSRMLERKRIEQKSDDTLSANRIRGELDALKAEALRRMNW